MTDEGSNFREDGLFDPNPENYYLQNNIFLGYEKLKNHFGFGFEVGYTCGNFEIDQTYSYQVGGGSSPGKSYTHYYFSTSRYSYGSVKGRGDFIFNKLKDDKKWQFQGIISPYLQFDMLLNYSENNHESYTVIRSSIYEMGQLVGVNEVQSEISYNEFSGVLANDFLARAGVDLKFRVYYTNWYVDIGSTLSHIFTLHRFYPNYDDPWYSNFVPGFFFRFGYIGLFEKD